MGTATLRKCVRHTRHSKPDWTGILDGQNATASGARPQKQAKQSSKLPTRVN